MTLKNIKRILVLLLIVLSFFVGNIYALRVAQPTKITAFDNNAIIVLNNALEQIWNLSNGRFNLDVKTSVPTWTGKEGDIVAYYSGTTYKLYIYLNSGWRSWTSD